MPTRLVDGDAIDGSDKLAACKEEYVPHYEKLLTLALANGSFEYNVEKITRAKYGHVMPHMTPDQVRLILLEFERHKLLFRWRTPDGKLWGYWVKIEKRLPAASHVRRGNYGLGAPVPVKELAEFLGRALEDVAAELEGTAADVRTISGKDKVRTRKGKGRDGSTNLSSPADDPPQLAPSSPTAPPPQAAAENEKKNKGSFFFQNQHQPPKKIEGEEQAGPTQGDFGRFAVTYRAAAGRLPGGGPSKREIYEALCREFGEEAVLAAVKRWAAQRGGPDRLAGNRNAAWDFLKGGEGRAEILGSRGSKGAGFEEKLQAHRKLDERTMQMLGKA